MALNNEIYVAKIENLQFRRLAAYDIPKVKSIIAWWEYDSLSALKWMIWRRYMNLVVYDGEWKPVNKVYTLFTLEKQF